MSNNTPIAKALLSYEEKIGCQIKLNQAFYVKVGVNKKRFGQLIRGEKEPLANEIKALATFFNVSVTELI